MINTATISVRDLILETNLRRDRTKQLLILMILAIALVGMASAANYMYEKASVKGVGYKNTERIISTQVGFNGTKLVEKSSGSGNVIEDKTELEAERQIGSNCGLDSFVFLMRFWHDPNGPGDWNWPIPTNPGDYGPLGPWIYLDFPDPDRVCP